MNADKTIRDNIDNIVLSIIKTIEPASRRDIVKKSLFYDIGDREVGNSLKRLKGRHKIVFVRYIFIKNGWKVVK